MSETIRIFRKLLRLNVPLLLSMLALVTIGTVAIWSAGNARTEMVFHGMWKANLTTACFGLIVYLTLSLVDYRRLLDLGAAPAYAVALALLVAVLAVGSVRFGGRRWLWFFQPSEIAKICVIVFVAHIWGGSVRDALRGFKGFALAGVVIGFPLVLILLEPDLGTALVLVPATLVMLFVARVWRRGLVTLFVLGGVAALAILGAVYEAERPGISDDRRMRILSMVPLKDHQLKRVRTFLFPERDAKGAGYNLRQAKISIGSGGFTGKGLGKGEVNHLKYLPPAISTNDFIFCVYAEETGYVGSLVLLALFGALIVPGAWVAIRAGDDRGRLLALGVSTLVFAHVYVNVAMSIGLVPITGLPLPFISSGRTFLLAVMAGLGLIQSVSIHREVEKR